MYLLFLNVFKQKLYTLSLLLSFILSFLIHRFLFRFEFIDDYFTIYLFIFFLITILLSICFFIFLKNISDFFKDVKSKKAGQELQKKILFVFSIIALTPTIVIALFAIFIFDTTLNGWFNKKISTAITQSVEVANKYLLEHQNAMRGDILELANILNVNSSVLSSDKKKFNKFLNNYTLKHNLSEAVIIDSIGNVLAFSEFVFEYTYTEIPQKYYVTSNQGQIIIAKEDNSNKMRAFLKLSQYIDAYLLITRFVDQKVLNAIESTSIAVSDYQSIELKQFDFKISFVLVFLLITIFLLLIVMIVGLNIANKLVGPIGSLISAAEEVGGGNLNYKITNQVVNNININELKRLAQAFNKMILDLKTNRLDLERANDQLDKRRKFSESVLSGVYSGVIGLDKDLKINLPNLTATKLLNISIDNSFGKPLVDIVPEFSNLVNNLLQTNNNVVEDKVHIIREDKILNLITRIVVQKTDDLILGYVLTFDDVTTLIAAQKMGAWSDIARRIAHEIKNPLTPIRLASERLVNHLNTNKKFDKKIFEQSLNMINRQVDDIHHLVDEFSSFARMPSPKLKVIDITKIVIEYLKPLASSFDNVVINIDNKISFALIMADEKQIRQAFGNLIKNSYENLLTNNIKNGKILVSFDTIKDFVSISIVDNGTGIKNSDINKIIEPYYTTKKNGSGLGLAITKKIIDDHNGSILITNLKSKDGTCILLKFPLVKEKYDVKSVIND
ncbi:ATP-binding protein [Alphaproteobacteria bacterium]|nr:ATP-binding protein [Alphaproteobacteria bacterium]